MPLGVGEPSLPPDPAFAAARAKLPVASPWPMRYRLKNTLDLYVAAPSLAAAHPAKAEFFPFATRHAEQGRAPQDCVLHQRRTGPAPAAGPKLKARAARSKALLVLTSADGSVQALNVRAVPGAVPDAGFAGGAAMELWLALALRLHRRADPEPDALRAADPGDEGAGAGVACAATDAAAREGFAYGIGAILSFAALGVAAGAAARGRRRRSAGASSCRSRSRWRALRC